MRHDPASGAVLIMLRSLKMHGMAQAVTDLIEHVRQGNEALAQQDITVIRRSLDNAKDDLGDTGKATVDGMFEGLDDCIDG